MEELPLNIQIENRRFHDGTQLVKVPASGNYSSRKNMAAKNAILLSSYDGFCANVFSACA